MNKHLINKQRKGKMPKKEKNSVNFINVSQGTCSPDATNNFKKRRSCFMPKDIQTLARMYNAYSPPEQKIPQSAFKDAKVLYQELRTRVPRCKDKHESCILHQEFVNDKTLFRDLMTRFRPKMPFTWKSNPREWLNNYNITHVMRQYESVHTDFDFLGVFPLDFPKDPNSGVCVVRKMCNFSLVEFLQHPKRQFGMIINLSKHNQPGSHWVAIYGAFDPEGRFCLVYFDSAGKKPPEIIKRFMRDIRDEAKELFFDIDFDQKFKTLYNQTPYQKKNTECGMFTMLFIIACLENESHDIHNIKRIFNENKLNDEKAFELRKYMFSDVTSQVDLDADTPPSSV